MAQLFQLVGIKVSLVAKENFGFAVGVPAAVGGRLAPPSYLGP